MKTFRIYIPVSAVAAFATGVAVAVATTFVIAVVVTAATVDVAAVDTGVVVPKQMKCKFAVCN